MTPSIGRIVHYVSYGTPHGEYKAVCRAAVITQVTQHPVADATVGLAVLNPTGMFFHELVEYDPGVGQADLAGEHDLTADRTYAQGCYGKWHAAGTWHPLARTPESGL